MTDVPTLTSATAANYPTWNPLYRDRNVTNGNIVISDGNLKVLGTSTNGFDGAYATMGMTTGKFYMELTFAAQVANYYPQVGITIQQDYGTAALGFDNSLNGACIQSNGRVVVNGSIVATYAAYGNGDVLNIAFDADNKKIWFGKNGTFTGSPSAGTSPAATFTSSAPWFLTAACGDSEVGYVNFGQQPFAYTPPTGYVALNSYNI
jgi:hypothetical protein